MISAERKCPACSATLAADAAFCHKCGFATPTRIHKATGELERPDSRSVAESTRLAEVQAALGDIYEVRRLLGRGGFAEVFVAFDKRLKREIAVKTIRGDLVVNANLRERFQREAEAVAKLRHPNVIPIFSVGESSGLVFFTMPLIEGESLAVALQRERRLSVEESVRILREASQALHAAHRAGIVHRDVKPDNIMLEGPERSVVVMDFGIAKSIGTDAPGLTGTGMLVGTPHYMSPEQALGAETLDARSDQYALAAVGYRMLTGRPPVEGNQVQALIVKTITDVPPPACEIAPDVPKEISDILARALSKRPEDRFESMAALAESLAQFERASSGTGEPARRRSQPDLASRMRDVSARAPRLAIWIGGAAVAIGGAIAVYAISTPRVPLMLAANRDEAIFAAKTFLNKHGVRGNRHEYSDFSTNDTSFRFLQRQLGFQGTQTRALSDVPVWQWSISSLAKDTGASWVVNVGPNNRITEFRSRVADTASAVTVSIDSARSLAQSELARLGWSLDRFDPLPDSLIKRTGRTDYVFRWRQRSGVVPWRGSDSAFVQLMMTVGGDRVLRFRNSLKLPDSYRNATVPDWLGALGTLSAVLTFLLSIVVLMRQQRIDTLQWQSIIRILGFVVAGLFIYIEVNSWNGTPQLGLLLIAFLVAVVFFGMVGVFIATAGESLTYAQNPAAVAGIADIAHGRLIIPEMITSATRGYLVGGTIGLLSAAGVFAALRLGVGAAFLPHLPFSRVALIDAIIGPSAGAALVVFALLFVAAVAFRIPHLGIAAYFLPGLIAALVLRTWDLGTAFVTAIFFSVSLLTYTLWRYGVVTAIIAVLVAACIEDAVALARAGGSEYSIAVAVLVAIMSTPAVLAVLASRRFSKLAH